MDFKLSPELDALKRTMRQMVQDECLPLEPTYLANPPRDGVDDGGPTGIAEAVMGIVGTLPKGNWDRLEQLSKDTGIYTAHLPEEYSGGALGALGHVVIDEESHRSIVQLPVSPVPMMLLGVLHTRAGREVCVAVNTGREELRFRADGAPSRL